MKKITSRISRDMKILLSILGLIIALGGAAAVIGQACKSVDAAIVNKIMSVEITSFDTLHRPLLTAVSRTAETSDKTYALVKSLMTPEQVEKALRDREIDRSIRGRGIERRW